MHETVFASSLLKIVLEELNRHQATSARRYQIERIDLHLGLLTCLEDQTLKGCFELLAEESPAATAELRLTRLPLCGFCPNCSRQAQISSPPLACPHCGARQVNWQGGRESLVAAIEVKPV